MKRAIETKSLINDEEIINEDREDTGLLKLMSEVDRNDLVPREEIMEKLKENSLNNC